MVTELTKTVIGKFWASGGNCLSQLKLFRPAPLFVTNVLTNPLFSQRGYQAYKAKYP